MTADDLTQKQLRQLAADVSACRGYFHKFAKRIQASGFSQADPLLLEVLEAEDAALKLWTSLHYRECGQKVGFSYPAFRKAGEGTG